ncbi:MAG: hypothetical protein ACRC51_11370 [Cetobacterium sp.]
MNLIILFICIDRVISLKELSHEKKSLNQIQKSLKKTLLEKEIALKEYNEKLEKIEFKKESKEYDDFIFEGTEDVLDYLNSLNKKNNLNLEIVGREVLEEVDGKIYGNFYYELYGSELGVYNFISELEEQQKFIALKMNSIMLETDGVDLYLKANVMYIINNKKNKMDYDYYNNGIFKKIKSRNIEGKRRML